MARILTILVLLGLLAGWGCDKQSDALVVLAASSTTEVMNDFLAQNAVPAVVSFGGSASLRLQLQMGGRADVFVSADRRQIEALPDKLTSSEPMKLAGNRIVIAVPADSELRSWRDLAEARRIVIGSPEVPIGRYADQFLTGAADEAWRNAVRQNVVSRESNTRLLRSKLELAEADAAIVYSTDLRGRNLRRIAVPDRWAKGEGVWGLAVVEDPRAAQFLKRLKDTDVWVERGFERPE